LDFDKKCHEMQHARAESVCNFMMEPNLSKLLNLLHRPNEGTIANCPDHCILLRSTSIITQLTTIHQKSLLSILTMFFKDRFLSNARQPLDRPRPLTQPTTALFHPLLAGWKLAGQRLPVENIVQTNLALKKEEASSVIFSDNQEVPSIVLTGSTRKYEAQQPPRKRQRLESHALISMALHAPILIRCRALKNHTAVVGVTCQGIDYSQVSSFCDSSSSSSTTVNCSSSRGSFPCSTVQYTAISTPETLSSSVSTCSGDDVGSYRDAALALTSLCASHHRTN